MRTGIEQSPHTLLPFPKNDIAAHNQGANRYLAGLERRAPERETASHVGFVDLRPPCDVGRGGDFAYCDPRARWTSRLNS